MHYMRDTVQWTCAHASRSFSLRTHPRGHDDQQMLLAYVELRELNEERVQRCFCGDGTCVWPRKKDGEVWGAEAQQKKTFLFPASSCLLAFP